MGRVGRSTIDRSGKRHGKETPDSYRPSRDLDRINNVSDRRRKDTDGLMDNDNARSDSGDYSGGQ